MSDAPALAGINVVDDIENADDFAKKHVPFVDVAVDGDVYTVTVKVGYWVAHPNMPDHYIEWIEILANGAPIARYDMSAVAVDPNVVCTMKLEAGTELTVLESCNLHGVWANGLTL